MGFRFRRSLKLAPGIRLNISKSGFGMSVGPRGATLGIGPAGVFANVGLPGSGISYRASLGNRQSLGRETRPRQNRITPAQSTQLSVRFVLQDDGVVRFCDAEGAPLPPALEKIAKKQLGETIRAWLAAECQKFTEQVESLDGIHLSAPPPYPPLQMERAEFESTPPSLPALKTLGLLDRLFSQIRERIEQENAAATRAYEEALQALENKKAKFQLLRAATFEIWERRLQGDTDAMQRVLEARLASISWPRETNISFEIPDAATVWLDVDLPEIEDIPTKTATVPARGWRLSVKPLTERRIRDLYVRHVHGIGFRLAAEVFAALPTAKNLIISGYSQRPRLATGQLEDQYLYSVRIPREGWQTFAFDHLDRLEPVEALAQFDLRRDLSRTGVFRPIVPFVSGPASGPVSTLPDARMQLAGAGRSLI